jgi:hypothetical protein
MRYRPTVGGLAEGWVLSCAFAADTQSGVRTHGFYSWQKGHAMSLGPAAFNCRLVEECFQVLGSTRALSAALVKLQ